MKLEKRKRIYLLDTLRGAALTSMILYHGCWNLIYLHGMDWYWYQYGKGAYYWQQSICITFILLSGFCLSMTKGKIKNGVIVFASGILVTLVTLFVMPRTPVIFGVLTFLGSAQLIVTVMRPLLQRIPSEMGAAVSFFLFIITKKINSGRIGIGEYVFIRMPGEWYSNLITTYLGFPSSDFVSTDYFSLFPWIFLFLTGFYIYPIIKEKEKFRSKIWQLKLPLFTVMGKHSLLIYLLHQPILNIVQLL